MLINLCLFNCIAYLAWCAVQRGRGGGGGGGGLRLPPPSLFALHTKPDNQCNGISIKLINIIILIKYIPLMCTSRYSVCSFMHHVVCTCAQTCTCTITMSVWGCYVCTYMYTHGTWCMGLRLPSEVGTLVLPSSLCTALEGGVELCWSVVWWLLYRYEYNM